MEKLSFKITFSTEIDKAQDPCAEILLNSIIVVPRQPIKDNQTIEFTCELFEDMDYELAI